MKLATKFKPTDDDGFSTAIAAGFRFAEFWLGPDLLRQSTDLGNRARQYSMQYALHFPNKGELNFEQLDNAVDLYSVLDCGAMVIHRPMYRKYGSILMGIDSGVRLAVENHKLDEEGILRWATEHDWLTLDIEHLWKFTLADGPLTQLVEFLGKFLDQFAGKVAHVHLPGYLPGYQEHRPMFCSRDMVFEALSLLAAHEYGGYIVSEVNMKFQNAEEMRMDTLLFERWQQLHLGEGAAGAAGKRVA